MRQTPEAARKAEFKLGCILWNVQQEFLSIDSTVSEREEGDRSREDVT
jgi:hypothetical protein